MPSQVTTGRSRIDPRDLDISSVAVRDVGLHPPGTRYANAGGDGGPGHLVDARIDVDRVPIALVPRSHVHPYTQDVFDAADVKHDLVPLVLVVCPIRRDAAVHEGGG